MTEASDQFGRLSPGKDVRIVKLGPDGTEVASYSGTLVGSPADWLVARAVWKFHRMDLGYMLFEPDDYLLEYFSTREPFNAFALFSPAGQFKGWYCNITYPTTVDGDTLYWHDLYIDVVQQMNGSILVLDEDELDEAGLATSDPDVHSMIMNARDLVVGKMRNAEYPFSETDTAPR